MNNMLRFLSFRFVLLMGLAGLLWIFALSDSRADATKPPATGELYNFEGTLNLSELKLDKGVTAGVTDSNGVKMIKLDFAEFQGYPGVNFPIPAGGWDLSGYTGIQVDLKNPGPDEISVNMRVDNEGDWKLSPWSVDVIAVPPGGTKTLKVVFGQTYKSAGFKLDPAHITAIKVFPQGMSKPTTLLINKLMAFKDSGAAAPAAPAAPATPAVAQTYLTTTTSPTNHAVPYGQEWELVKDWTFGNKRADATIHNKDELDKDFYYRYIYENAKLDILPTYWTYHRDYPEGDPKSLHVFGDNTLTLKARIPEGGGLHPRGIESGMLRGKMPFVPGMYVEMRCKVTKGVGAWPAFWLGTGVQYDNGTFSKLPWPPEIDIFEFFGFKNRPTPKTFSSNIQTNKKPELYGPPHDIFSVFQKSDYTPGMDFSEDFHVFALDWQENRPIWLLDGHPIKQTYYEWHAPPAHILVTNQLGIEFAKPDMKEMVADEANWDYVIDYIRVWKHPGVVVPSTEPPATAPVPAPAK